MRKLSELDNLIHVNRYSGNLLVKKESVADHVWCMNALALEFVPELNSRFGLSISLEKVIYSIALHDIDEAFYCDIPRKFKYRTPELRSAIANAVEDILESTLDHSIVSDIKIAEDKHGYIGCVVKILDLAQAGYKMTSEIKLGNEYFKGEIDNVIDSLYGLKDLIDNSFTLHNQMKPALAWLCEIFINEFVKLSPSYNSDSSKIDA